MSDVAVRQLLGSLWESHARMERVLADTHGRYSNVMTSSAPPATRERACPGGGGGVAAGALTALASVPAARSRPRAAGRACVCQKRPWEVPRG